jgi:hypothetical protein
LAARIAYSRHLTELKSRRLKRIVEGLRGADHSGQALHKAFRRVAERCGAPVDEDNLRFGRSAEARSVSCLVIRSGALARTQSPCARRDIALALPHFVAVLGVLAATDLLATLPERLAHILNRGKAVHIYALPVQLPKKASPGCVASWPTS